ncbi:transcription termination/antitermination NusG family protein [Rhizobium sp. SG570]|uniref:transcription termination/antitermination NusG family protein n=1 Tax=Rhizobium sp. SG570 TaxID=2587113 RepID=UPI001FEEB319|nr:transcription termination/antitermination NusG family protein [Rhizobium sp. SG570]
MPIDVDPRLTRGQRWYVFRSLARAEGLAEANLTRQGFIHFLPKVTVVKRHARRYVTHKEWLFPRYGFLLMDLSRDRWQSVNGTYGVERLVMGQDGPQRLPDGVIEALQAATGSDGLFCPDMELILGAQVRVSQGPLSGQLGVLQSLDGRGRVELLLNLMNGQVRTTVARECVEIVA